MNKENKKETVCAVVVTYNRKNLLLECLEAIRRQTRPVDGIYIIDNASDDGTPELLKEKGYIPELPPFNISEPYEIEHKISNLVDGNPIKVFYVRMHENTGGAGGFYEGVKRGYERGYDWLWLMDDDVTPHSSCLRELINESEKNILSLLPIRVDLKGEKINWFPFFSKVFLRSWNSNPKKSNTIYFEGFIMHRHLIERVGFPESKFFTVLDDTEYGLRISKVEKVKYVDSAVLVRLLPNSDAQPLYKRYYFFRNLFLLSKLMKIPFLWCSIIVFFQLFFSLLKTLFLEKQKMLAFKILIKSYIDGITGKFGRANF